MRDPSDEELALRLIEADHWVATLRRDQQFLGTAFVTARRHVESLPELTAEESSEFITVQNQLIIAQQKAFGAKVVNVSCLMNHAFDKNGQGEPHVHYHFKPRYAAAVKFAGQEFTDKQFGEYISVKKPHVVGLPDAIQIAETIRSSRMY
jgi:diadenosine tetraphosphate (Ap4A) HIT family hydrolase